MNQQQFTLHCGDSALVLKDYPDNHFDSIVTDPPYGISFLGKDWDSKKATETTSKLAALHNLPSGMKHTSLADDLAFQTWMRDVFVECLRVLKPGGHLLAFSAARTYHHMAMAAQTAGFEIRDQIMWIYGSGFPKSQDIGRTIQKQLGVKETRKNPNGRKDQTDADSWSKQSTKELVVPTDPLAKQWAGWGSALKPAHEPIVVARKPLTGTVAANVLAHGVGGLHIDACRVAHNEVFADNLPTRAWANADGKNYQESGHNHKSGTNAEAIEKLNQMGRFPANIIHDGSDEVTSLFPDSKAGVERGERGTGGIWSAGNGKPCGPQYGDSGSAARFFYSAKTSKKERNCGTSNNHPTVKPQSLMEYLIKLVTPSNGRVLDPFNGSGSTGMAAVKLGHHYTGIDLDQKYIDISHKRIVEWNSDNTVYNQLFEDDDK